MPRRDPNEPPPAEPPPVYGLADLDTLGAETFVPAVRAMAAAGIGWIQLRMKHASGAQAWALAHDSAQALADSAARLWIDDRADLAKMVGAAGVHVGQRDLPPAATRRVVGPATWIGASTHDPGQVADADTDLAVDVIAIGPVFATASKRNPDPVVGLDGVRRARARTRKPLVAIGGIDTRNAAAVRAAGADTVAVLGALCRGAIETNARRLIAAVEVGA